MKIGMELVLDGSKTFPMSYFTNTKMIVKWLSRDPNENPTVPVKVGVERAEAHGVWAFGNNNGRKAVGV